MLYVTTRGQFDVFTPPITLNQNQGSDGGLFVPFHMPKFSREEIQELSNKSFGQNVADILNLFFNAKLTGWDVDMAIGRYLLKLKPIHYRVLVAELWHNMDHSFDKCVRVLSQRIHPDGDVIGTHTDWSEIAIRISALFGIFGELLRTEQVSFDKPINVAVTSGAFRGPMAVWYAREMGLPIGTIICGCNENGTTWELLHRGELNTATLAVETSTPECDYAIAPDLERLINATCGLDETMRFCWSCTEGSSYMPEPSAYEAIRKGMFAAVVSQARVESIIPSVYNTGGYILDLYSALAYGALSDFRSRTGSSGMTLLLSEKSPVCQEDTVARTMRITAAQLQKLMAEV